MKIAIALFDGCYASSFSGPQDVFQIANYLGQSPDSFTVALLSDKGRPVKLASGGEAQTMGGFDHNTPYDLIYLPSFPYFGEAELDQLITRNQTLIQWLQSAWNQGAVLSASCTATFLLAETGLLNKRKATTTWWLERQFRQRYPSVLLDKQAIMTRDNRIMTAGAMTSSLNLIIEIVAQFGSTDLAQRCARALMIDTSRQVQPFQQSLVLDASSTHPVVQRAQHWLQNHLTERIEIPRLAEHLGVSPRSLNRYFRQELGQTTLEYLQSLRVEKAKTLLERTRLPLAQIVADVGYSDVRSFTALFHRQVGMSPRAYRDQTHL
ncbi:MAG: helix-turn-helix domain-containing protein [Mangrovicoccus sp.]|nr:helix-turn-helix domain-containing protein [Mangrovicoccus sp.]